MKLFDLHCDTAYEMYKRKCGLVSNGLHVSLDRLDGIEKYIQLTAVWCDENRNDEECYSDFFKILKHFEDEKQKRKWETVLTVEDARLLCRSIERLDVLAEYGVKVLTPLWSGKTVIGGSFNTSDGLSDFGKEVIKRCFELGIIPDISHASVESANDIFMLAEKAGKPVIASHSCSYSVYAHPRNLRDDQLMRIKELGGVAGLSFCSYHLTDKNNKCTSDDILRHLEHYLALYEDGVCIGADMDGAPLPCGIEGIGDMPALYDIILQKFGKEIADKITWENAYNFFERN